MTVAAALLAAALLLGAGGAPAPTADSAKAMLEAIYSGYVTPHASTWSGHPDAFFDASITRLLKEDARIAKGEVGVMDGDPFCDCQDFGKVRYAIAVAPPAGGKAQATVRFTSLGRLTVFRYDLVATPEGWRIADIHTAREPSFKAWLTKAVADERAGR